jgi:hypothetical protein
MKTLPDSFSISTLSSSTVLFHLSPSPPSKLTSLPAFVNLSSQISLSFSNS